MSKSADAFRTISEVADWLGVQAHVLRFWESKFSQIKPVKRAGGRRYYRPADMLLLGGIQKLLHEDGLSIKEVQTILRDLGIAHVSQLSHDLEADGPPAHRNTTRDANKKSNGAKDKPEDASAAEIGATPTEPVDASLPHDPVAAALLSTPTASSGDMPQPSADQETPVDSTAWRETTPEATKPDDTALAPGSVEAPSPPVPSAEMPHEALPVADPVDAAEAMSADGAAARPAEEPAPSIAEDPMPSAPAQMDMELGAPVDHPVDEPVDGPVAPSPAAPGAEDIAVATMPSHNEAPENSTPEIPMAGAEVAPGKDLPAEDFPVEDASQASVQPETETSVSPDSPGQSIPAGQEAPSGDHLPGPETDLTFEVDPSPAAPIPDSSAFERTDPVGSEVRVQPVEPLAETASVASVEAADLATLPTEAASGETPKISGTDMTETAALPDRSQNVLSLLEQTTVLPTHIQADVANCAAELRALLALR